MRQILAIAWLQFRLLLKARGFLMVMFVLPLAFTAVMAVSVGGGQAKPVALAVVDADQSFAARQLIETLRADKALAISLSAADSIDRLLADHRAAAALVIPSGFERSVATEAAPELQLIESPGSQQPTLRLAIMRAAEAVTTIYDVALATSGGQGGVQAAYADVAADRKEIAVEQSVAGIGTRSPELAERTLAFTVMFVVMAIMMLGGTLLDERQAGTWNRMLCATASRPIALAGMFTNLVAAGLAQFAGLAIASHLLFGVAWGAPLALAAVATATTLCAAGLAVLIASLSRTSDQHRLMSMMLAVVAAMFGGLYWSLDLVSPTMRKLGHLAPQAWAMDGLRAVALHQGGWAEVAAPVAVLTAIALLSAAVGLRRFSAGPARSRRAEAPAAPAAV